MLLHLLLQPKQNKCNDLEYVKTGDTKVGFVIQNCQMHTNNILDPPPQEVMPNGGFRGDQRRGQSGAFNVLKMCNILMILVVSH